MMTLKQEMVMWTWKKGEFIGQTEKEVIKYLDDIKCKYEYEPETEDEYGYITIGKEYEYSDQYEIVFSDGECIESEMIIWD